MQDSQTHPLNMASLRSSIVLLSNQLSFLLPHSACAKEKIDIDNYPVLEEGIRSLYSVSRKAVLSPHEVGLSTTLKVQSAIFTKKPTPLEVLIFKKNGNPNFPYICGRATLVEVRKLRESKKKVFENGMSTVSLRVMNQSKKLRELWDDGHLNIDISGEGYRAYLFETYLDSTAWMRFHWPRVGTMADHQLTVTAKAKQFHDDLMAVIRPRAKRHAENMLPYIKDLDKNLPKGFSLPPKLKRANAPTHIFFPRKAHPDSYDQVHLLSFEEQPPEDPTDYPSLSEFEGSDFFATEYLLALVNQRWISTGRTRVVTKGSPPHKEMDRKAIATFNRIWPVKVERLIKRGHAATDEYVDVQQWFAERIEEVEKEKKRVLQGYTRDFMALVGYRDAVVSAEDRKIYDVEPDPEADLSSDSNDDKACLRSESSSTTTVSVSSSQGEKVSDLDRGYGLDRGTKLEQFPVFDGCDFKADDVQLEKIGNCSVLQALVAGSVADDDTSSNLVANKQLSPTTRRARQSNVSGVRPTLLATKSQHVSRFVSPPRSVVNDSNHRSAQGYDTNNFLGATPQQRGFGAAGPDNYEYGPKIYGGQFYNHQPLSGYVHRQQYPTNVVRPPPGLGFQEHVYAPAYHQQYQYQQQRFDQFSQQQYAPRNTRWGTAVPNERQSAAATGYGVGLPGLGAIGQQTEYGSASNHGGFGKKEAGARLAGLGVPI
ncbi:hypothetical protein BDV96DRAFT_199101 [Lophiotrema nucula]|uniref:Uncharacterized protein n=1 Tax=Lophiotrema nucula TaxID=690887 RepID=A0A6A5YXB7_9PLEO|nr:hypothetical protein BDV96DRAFT_199101 [Lophiotrema nucula]